MRIVFMGTPQFAVPSLKILHENHQVAAVICQPDKPNQRGNKITFGPVKKLALELGLEVIQPLSVKDSEFADIMRGLKAEVVVVVAYGKILPKEILDMPKYGCINLHASLLPKYRGATPIQWAIINGEHVTGITIMRMSQGLDTGDMILKKPINIEHNDNYGTLMAKMAELGAGALIEALTELKEGRAKSVIQNDAEATYAPIIEKEIGHINWQNKGRDIVNLIRGLNPAPSAYCKYEGQKLKILNAEVLEKKEESSDFGRVVDVIHRRGIVVSAKHERILITELQGSGGKKMNASDYIRGRQGMIGQILE